MTLWMGLFTLLLLALLGIGVWLVVRQLTDISQRKESRESLAMRTLRERYARGEVDSATFEEMQAHLESRSN